MKSFSVRDWQSRPGRQPRLVTLPDANRDLRYQLEDALDWRNLNGQT